jgi:hypothetical protein
MCKEGANTPDFTQLDASGDAAQDLRRLEA